MDKQTPDKKDAYLTGRLLLAMPQMGDPRFHRAVIFMCAHDENGAMGLVLNNVMPGLDLSELLGQLNIDRQAATPAAPVMNGGPVETARGFVLHSTDFAQPETVRVGPELGVTGTIEALRAIAAGDGPQKMLFMLGYAGWGAGQLDRELQQNAWLVTDADAEIIFGDAERKWDRAVRKIGIDPAMLSGDAGHA